MKNHMIVALLVSFSVAQYGFAQGNSAGERESDLGPQLQIALPGAGDYDLYESGFGLELQFRNWLNASWGYLAAVGYSEWDADADADDPGANLYDFDGSVEFVSAGLSVLFTLFAGDDYDVTLEGGLRYLMLDSKITARNSDHSPAERYDVDIDDALIARAAAAVDYRLNDDFILSGGLAYHFDIDRSDLSTELGPGRENIMDAFLVEIALRMPL